MHSEIKRKIQEMGFDCPICLEQYNNNQNYPMILCINQHSACKECIQSTIFKTSTKAHCPQCRLQIDKKQLIPFRYFENIKNTADALRRHGSRIRQLSISQTEAKKLLEEEIQKNQWLMKQIQQKETFIHNLKDQNTQLLTKKQQLQKIAAQLQEKNTEICQKLNSYGGGQNHNLKINPNKLNPVLAISWIDEKAFGYLNMQATGYIITAKKGVDIFSKTQISKKPRFSVTFLQLRQGAWVGVVDTLYKTNTSLSKMPNLISINNDGVLWNGIKQQQVNFRFKGFQTVQIQVDLNEGYIVWSCGQYRVEKKFNALLNKKICWVPYLNLPFPNDKATIND